jgi:hypothetical protein
MDGLLQISSYFNFSEEQFNSIICGFDLTVGYLFLVNDDLFIYSDVKGEYRVYEINVLQFIDDLKCSQKLGNPINWVYVEVFCSSDVQKLIVDPETESRKILPLSPTKFVRRRV